MEQGYERHYLKIISGAGRQKQAFGLACVNVDQTQPAGARAFIRHLSVSEPRLLKQALDLVLDFIWRRIPVKEIRVEVFHFKNKED